MTPDSLARAYKGIDHVAEVKRDDQRCTILEATSITGAIQKQKSTVSKETHVKGSHHQRKQRAAATFLSIRNRYIIGFTIMSLADWLQGPFLLPMYQSFGLNHSEVALLYGVDVFSAAAAGLFIGPITDVLGSRTACIWYGVVYGISCLCNHLHSLWIPMVGLGCILDGMCNALLRTSFESWLVNITNQRVFLDFGDTTRDDVHSDVGIRVVIDLKEKDRWMTHAFAAASWASSACSLAAGLICHGLVHGTRAAVGGNVRKDILFSPLCTPMNEDHLQSAVFSDDPIPYIATMDVAAALLFIGAVWIHLYWESDETNSSISMKMERIPSTITSLQSLVRQSTHTLILGFQTIYTTSIQNKLLIATEVCLEAALVLFINALPGTMGDADSETPFGITFVSLMASLLLGTALGSLAEGMGLRLERGLVLMCLVLSVSAGVIALVLVNWHYSQFGGISVFGIRYSRLVRINTILFPCMCLIEVCFGFYYPALAHLHEAYASSNSVVRSTCINVTRSASCVVSIVGLVVVWQTGSLVFYWLFIMLVGASGAVTLWTALSIT